LIVAAVEAGGPEPPMTAGQLDGGGAHARLALPRRRRPSDWDEGRPLRSIGAAYVDTEEARAARTPSPVGPARSCA
jgi:hypothetical protein